MATLLAAPFNQFADANGAPLAGGKVYTYVAGSGYTTPKASYTDSTGSTLLSNPVVLDSAGRTTIWLSGSYGIVVKDSLGNTISSTDNISSSTSSGGTGDMTAAVYDPALIQQQLVGLTATQTITNKTFGAGCVFPASVIPYAHINGCLLSSISGNHTTASITVGSGQATDRANAVYITSAGYSWAAANGNAINGTDAGSATLANSTVYHMFLCSGNSGTGTFCSASLTPTFPTGYTVSSRRIGSFATNGSGAPLPYISVEIEGGGTVNWLATQTQDVNVNNLGTSRVLYTLNVPTGIKVAPIVRYSAVNSTSGFWVILTSGDETDIAPAVFGTVPGSDTLGTGASLNTSFFSTSYLTTNTSGQIGARSSAGGTNLCINTRGWIDFRRN